MRVMGLHTPSNNLYIYVWFEEVGNVNNTTVNKDLLQHVLYFLWHIEKVVQLWTTSVNLATFISQEKASHVSFGVAAL